MDVQRVSVFTGQTLVQTFDLSQAVQSPEIISGALVEITPDDGGCVATVDSFSDKQVVASFEGVGANYYDAQIIVDTSASRALKVCFPLVVLLAPAAAFVEVSQRPGEVEKYSFYYGLRMKPGETLQGVAAQVPAGVVASFALDPEHTQQIMGDISVEDSAADGVYDIQLQVMNSMSPTYNDVLRVFVEDCYG